VILAPHPLLSLHSTLIPGSQLQNFPISCHCCCVEMRAKGFVCPNLSSLFRPSVAAPADPAVFDVANAIYHGGRADGVPGLEAVAHVIQNRCHHPAFPCEPQAVVLAGAEQFGQVRPGSRTPQTSAERQLFDQARRLATQLVQHPHRLPFPDPTGGAVYYDQRGPASLHSAGRPFNGSGRVGRSTSSSSGVASASASQGRPSVPSAQHRLPGQAEAPDPPSEDDVGAEEPPRPSPQKSRRPLSFFRDRGTGMGMVRGNVNSPIAGGNGQLPPQHGGAMPALGHAQLPAAAIAGTSPMQPAPSAGRSSLGSAPAPSGVAPRPLPRPMLPGRGGPMGLAPQHPLMSLHRGPTDEDGYHDMILPCGLFQEEVIEIMYRDLKPEDFDMLNKLDERLPKKNIVQRNLVERLPRCLAADCGCSECGVCLAELDPGARVVQLPCRHAFHPLCISRWLTQCKNTCPLCSALIDTSPEARAQHEARAQEVARSHEAAARALAEGPRSV